MPPLPGIRARRPFTLALGTNESASAIATKLSDTTYAVVTAAWLS